MRVFNKISEITDYLFGIRNEKTDISIGFVPTMGTLHEGHLSLIRKSKSENDITVCSIYVNPLQFNDKSDYEKYPKNFDKDIELLKSIDCDLVFIPSPDEMLPEGDYPDYDLSGLDVVLEGKSRPGHFKGVVYIVKKLLTIVKPDLAYFGLKDFQQYIIVKHAVKLCNLNVLIKGCPIVRDYDGLALSSRNIRLSSENRSIAPVIYKTLKEIKQKYNDLSIEELKQLAINSLKEYNQISLDYFEIIDMEKLTPISDKNSHNVIACIAVYLQEIRLIDNIILF